MSSWGRKADVVLTGKGSISANTNTITGANTVFTTEVEVRDVIDLDGQGTFVVTSVVNNTTLLVNPKAGSTASTRSVLLSETPKYLPADQAINEAVFVTVTDAQDADNRVDGIKTPGWNLVKTIGNNRKSVETLVAMKQTSTT